jgi:cardiolipin synthase A/B
VVEFFEKINWLPYGAFLVDLLIRVGLSVRVVKRRLPVGVSLAWLSVILVLPYVGAVLYLLVGEYRLGPRRARRSLAYKQSRSSASHKGIAHKLDPTALPPEAGAIAQLASTTLDAQVLSGNRLQLLDNADTAFPVLIADIEQAKRTCFLEFYIWSNGGVADKVGEALIRAAQRGVKCLVLVDAMGSKGFLRSQQAKEMRQNGVRVEAAMQAGLLRLLLVRPDLRMHRKIGLIDGQFGYTGSLNLADPLYFKKEAGVGQWVDALVRVEGPAVDEMAEVFREDWYLETGDLLEDQLLLNKQTSEHQPGNARVQVMPTGPDEHVEAIEQVVLMALYCAKREVVLTTPYFVPSESLLTALLSAASRGVSVTLIVPAKVDSKLVKFASRANQTDLLKAGIHVAQFKGGLLHTKSITVDDTISLFGSLNLDPRSFRLDLEITLGIYDAEFTSSLRRLQQVYLDKSDFLDLPTCKARTSLELFAEDTTRLVGPIL